MTVHDAPRPAVKLSQIMDAGRERPGLSRIAALPWTGLSLLLAVCGLLLVVALPRSAEAERALGVERMELELHHSLRELRGAIRSYRAEHGVWPGLAPGPNPDSKTRARSAGWFTRQLLMRTDASGRPSLASLPSHRFGPYLRERVPVNAANGLASVFVLDPEQALPPGPDGLTGWIYSPATGGIRANCEGDLQGRGIRFYDL